VGLRGPGWPRGGTPIDVRAVPVGPDGNVPGAREILPRTPRGTPEEAALRSRFMVMPPTYFQPPSGRQFRAQGSVAAIVAASGETELGSFQLPTGNVGVIRQATFSANQLFSTTDITFRIRIDGAIPEGWAWKPFPSAVSFFTFSSEVEATIIDVPEGSTVQVTAQVFDAASYTLGGDLFGWFYSVSIRDAYAAAWGGVL